MSDNIHTDNHVCAVHDVVMNNLNEKIADLQLTQKETQALIKRSHEEVVTNLMEIAKFHREDIAAFKIDIEKDLERQCQIWEKRFAKLEENEVPYLKKTLENLRISNLKFYFTAAGFGAAAAFVVSHMDVIIKVFQ